MFPALRFGLLVVCSHPSRPPLIDIKVGVRSHRVAPYGVPNTHIHTRAQPFRLGAHLNAFARPTASSSSYCKLPL